MHAAKGLEFPVVFVVGTEEGIFPGIRAIGEPEEMEEERRLCYVAMTRAKEKLYMTCAHQRMLFGRTSANRPSRFVGEIPTELTEQSGRSPLAPSVEEDESWGYSRPARPTYGSGTSNTGFRQTGGHGGIRTPRQQERPSGPTGIQGGYTPRPSASKSGPLPDFHKGDMVTHKAFGKGMVLSIQPMGGDALIEIAFDTVGTKKLMLKSASQHMTKL